jgi:hypothetical protein
MSKWELLEAAGEACPLERNRAKVAPLCEPQRYLSVAIANSEAAILNRVIHPQNGDPGPTAARAILRIRLPEADHRGLNVLAAKASATPSSNSR